MRRIAQVLAGLAVIAGCDDEPTAVEKDIAALRAATRDFQSIAVAQSAGYDTQFPAGCFTSTDGAMGFHYLKAANVGTLTVTDPQLVMYEPQANGSMKLVGVEYIVPGEPSDTPPVLFDREFQYNATFEVWVLHVWAWENNPKGLYTDWNPNVTCDHASAVSPLSHH